MSRGRIINAVIFAWLIFSSVLQPVLVNQDDFWSEKLKQAFQINRYIFTDFARFLGASVLFAVLWFVNDWRLRRRERAKAAPSQISD